jgi:hypothetical protein
MHARFARRSRDAVGIGLAVYTVRVKHMYRMQLPVFNRQRNQEVDHESGCQNAY